MNKIKTSGEHRIITDPPYRGGGVTLETIHKSRLTYLTPFPLCHAKVAVLPLPSICYKVIQHFG